MAAGVGLKVGLGGVLDTGVSGVAAVTGAALVNPAAALAALTALAGTYQRPVWSGVGLVGSGG